jgi:hypothetical protein
MAASDWFKIKTSGKLMVLIWLEKDPIVTAFKLFLAHDKLLLVEI